eukprot:1358989-Prymnesium_polylepis.1
MSPAPPPVPTQEALEHVEPAYPAPTGPASPQGDSTNERMHHHGRRDLSLRPRPPHANCPGCGRHQRRRRHRIQQPYKRRLPQPTTRTPDAMDG